MRNTGFYTSGPVGSVSHTKGYWESAGVEASIWPRFGIASSEQRKRTLDSLTRVAMNAYGVSVFPYRPETDHFRTAAWVAWTVGMVEAAAVEGRVDIIEKLIAQQVRNAVINKTFYEVIHYPTGRAWRWPGQTWQACGFLCYFYFGLLGLSYHEDGLRFTPCVPDSLANTRLLNLRYRDATFDIIVQGAGIGGQLLLDGKPVTLIPATSQGKHTVELVLS